MTTEQQMLAFEEALAQAQQYGLAFIRVNANGHTTVMSPDRIRISVIEAVEDRTAAAHQECKHDWQHEFDGLDYVVICSNCGEVKG